MRIVVEESKILEFKVLDAFDCRIQLHPRQPPTLATQLLARLLEMVGIEMDVAKSMDEISRR